MPRDAGLQPERTGLAWRRSALAAFATGLLCLRAGVSTGGVTLLAAALLAAALLAAALSAAMLAAGVARPRYDSGSEAVVGPRAGRRAVAIAAGIVAVALMALLHVLPRLVQALP